jgi:hypothetical protein
LYIEGSYATNSLPEQKQDKPFIIFFLRSINGTIPWFQPFVEKRTACKASAMLMVYAPDKGALIMGLPCCYNDGFHPTGARNSYVTLWSPLDGIAILRDHSAVYHLTGNHDTSDRRTDRHYDFPRRSAEASQYSDGRFQAFEGGNSPRE